MLIQTLLTLALFGQAPRPSAFNSYAAHLGANAMRTACAARDLSSYRNLAYPFRSQAYPGPRSVQFRDGRHEERAESKSGREWVMVLSRQESIRLDQEPAVMLLFVANHLGGTGSVSHVLVIRCRNGRLEIVFEAGGEGLRASYARNGDLQVIHPAWKDSDAHAAPRNTVDERYQWSARRSRFVLLRRAEGEIKTR